LNEDKAPKGPKISDGDFARDKHNKFKKNDESDEEAAPKA